MTREEAMRRLMAVEPLPVGERLARWRWPTRSGHGSMFPRRCWVRLHAGLVSRNARPLRIARERAKALRTALSYALLTGTPWYTFHPHHRAGWRARIMKNARFP